MSDTTLLILLLGCAAAFALGLFVWLAPRKPRR